MMFKDYYKILGFDTNKVTLDEIKNAYREKAKKYHPDMNVGDTAKEEIFKDVNEAYKTLSNDKSRRKYDFNWNRYIGKRNKRNKREKKSIKDIFIDIFFGGITKNKISKKELPQYGEDINTEISISIKEAFYGVKKQLKFRNVEGKYTTISVQIPAGIQNGDKIRVVGSGKPGKNGGKNGDLFVIVNIANDEKIHLSGNDFYIEIPLKPWEAALGTKKQISVIDEILTIIIPKNTSSGNTITIKDKGYRKNFERRGNLHIIAKIIMPDNLSSKEIALYTELKNIDK